MKKNNSWINNYSLWRVGIIALVAVILVAGFCYTSLSKEKVEEDFMIKVDGVPITLTEFNRAVRKNRAYVVNYFYKKYNVQQSEKFWTTAINGEIPRDMLIKIAQEECTNIKMQQIVAQEKGILKDISYQGFLQELKNENIRREEAIKNKQVVYGPSQYSEDAYFDYLLFNAKLSIKKDMQERISEGELKQFYDAKKDELYLSQGSIKVSKINVSFLNNNAVDDALKKSMFEKMIEIKSRLLNGEDFKKITLEYMKTLEDSELQINMNENRKNLKSPVVQAALKLRPQEISDIIEENGSFYILKCIDRQDKGSIHDPFSEIKNQVLSDYLENLYTDIINNRILKAKVEVNEKNIQDYIK